MIGTIALGCYSTYSGIYYLRSAPDSSQVSPQQVTDVVGGIVVAFGFGAVDVQRDPSEGVWFSGRQAIAPEFAKLFGADSHITIAISSRPTSITIRDLQHATETPFMRALKNRIEEQMAEKFGLRDLKFARQADILS